MILTLLYAESKSIITVECKCGVSTEKFLLITK